MRCLLAAGLVMALGNQAPTNQQPRQGDIWITIAPSQGAGGSASVRVVRSEIYVDGDPSAGVGVGVPSAGPRVLSSPSAFEPGKRGTGLE
jgi:hypothetical protein